MAKISKKTKRVAIGVGAGVLTAAALAAAAGYLLSSKQQRAKVKAWAVKARREVAKNVRVAKRMGEKEYRRVVDQAVKRYGSMNKVNTAEILKTAGEMKAEWQRLRKNAEVIAKMAGVKKPARPKKVRRAKKHGKK